jgi:RNA polymerase sigma-70 factor (ECF subfamily)
MERSTKTPASAGPDPSESDLLGKARGGNLFAFEEIVKRYQRRVYAVAFRIVRRHDLADDVVQEAFIRAYESLGRFDTGRPFAPWIATIAANLALNHVRSPRFREEPLPEAHAEAPHPAPSPLGGLLEGEADAQLKAAMDRLPPEQRAVLVLRVVEDLSYKEIAESLGLSLGTVMSRLARAREKLREALLPYIEGAAPRARGGHP